MTMESPSEICCSFITLNPIFDKKSVKDSVFDILTFGTNFYQFLLESSKCDRCTAYQNDNWKPSTNKRSVDENQCIILVPAALDAAEAKKFVTRYMFSINNFLIFKFI